MGRSRTYAVGDRFSMLSIVEFAGVNDRGRKQAVCACDCGARKIVALDKLGYVRSCGCLMIAAQNAPLTHGQTYSREYECWGRMIQRCTNPKNKSWANYGGRGITVCEKWLSFEAFIADMGERPSPQHSIDRKDNSLGYSAENCRWATRSEQGRNTRSTRLNEDRVREIRVRRITGETCKSIALSMGVSHSLIKQVSRGEIWGDVQ